MRSPSQSLQLVCLRPEQSRTLNRDAKSAIRQIVKTDPAIAPELLDRAPRPKLGLNRALLDPMNRFLRQSDLQREFGLAQSQHRACRSCFGSERQTLQTQSVADMQVKFDRACGVRTGHLLCP